MSDHTDCPEAAVVGKSRIMEGTHLEGDKESAASTKSVV